MRAIIIIDSSDQAPIEVMHLLEIVNEFSLLSKALELLKFGHLLSFLIDPDAEWHSLFNDRSNSVHRPLDIIIFDGDLNLQHLEAAMAPLES
jgi:hypothetical protein